MGFQIGYDQPSFLSPDLDGSAPSLTWYFFRRRPFVLPYCDQFRLEVHAEYPRFIFAACAGYKTPKAGAVYMNATARHDFRSTLHARQHNNVIIGRVYLLP